MRPEEQLLPPDPRQRVRQAFMNYRRVLERQRAELATLRGELEHYRQQLAELRFDRATGEGRR